MYIAERYTSITTYTSNIYSTQPVSQVLSSQVTNDPTIATSNDTAVQLTFRYSDRVSLFMYILYSAKL